MRTDNVKKYLTSKVETPFFLFVSDNQYKSLLTELVAMEFETIQLSHFCYHDDKAPDIDGLLTYIKQLEASADVKGYVVTGLGEYLGLRGCIGAKRALARLKDHNFGGVKVVLLLRGLASLIPGLQSDPRFDNRRHSIIDQAECDLSFTLAAPAIGLSTLPGFKAMLKELENGRQGRIVVSTAVNLDEAMFTVHKISNAYEGISFICRGFSLARSCGSDAQWTDLLSELDQNGGSYDKVFEKHGFSENLESDFHARIAGSNYRNWLYFICLKSKAATLANGYLRFVLEKTPRFEDFKGNVLNAIIDIPHTDNPFPSLYRERKALVEKFPESDVAAFVVNNRQVVPESIFKLTDSTRVEREEIVAWLSVNGLVSQLDGIYPDLVDYLKKYIFKCSELADLLTDYFEAYKRQKLSNCLEPEFLERVDELARSRKFNRLPTRNEILDSVERSDTFLYWLDALGVEYLAFVEASAQRLGLSIRINIARAQLPTITFLNRDFFDEWYGRKEKNEALDDVKHSDSGGYNFKDNDLPIHLAKELEIIRAMMEKAATELALRNCKRFLIVSDHGASRLAVILRKEEKYETDTTGEHSGRCCKLFHPCDLPFAAEENGFLVLADYGRFKGSRAANVEVHGGASLEEVVVPVIELSLRDGKVTVKLVEETVTVDSRTGTEIELFFNSPQQDVSVLLGGKRYLASQKDANHYFVRLPDTKRAGNYPADVFAGDNLVGKITIKAQGKTGKVNDEFDSLF